MFARLSRWYLFSVVASVLPVLILWLFDLPRDVRQYPDLESLVEDGKMMIVYTTLCLAAAGEVIGKELRRQVVSIYASFGAVGTAVLAACLYGYQTAGSASYSPELMFDLSLWFAGFTLVTTTACVVVSGTS